MTWVLEISSQLAGSNLEPQGQSQFIAKQSTGIRYLKHAYKKAERMRLLSRSGVPMSKLTNLSQVESLLHLDRSGF